MATATATADGDAAAPAAAAAQLDSIKPPAGVIIPPPGEIREVIEKTAGYVVRGGVGIEERLRDNHSSNPKFSFVTSRSDAYNPYYEWRKDEYRAGRGTAVAAGRVGEAAPAPKKEEEPRGPPKPPDFQFSARLPRMNQRDLEVVRLTALFVARNGRQFMTTLSQREAGNPQFQFLIPNHTFHIFFQHMVDQYTILLKEGGAGGEGTKAQKARVEELQRNVDDKFHVLSRAKMRAEWAKWQEAEKKKKEEEEEKEREDFSRIDWNDFVIVETIVFSDADEQATLPPPTTLNDIQYASLEERNKVSVGANLRIEEAFPFDDTNYNAYPLQQQPQQPAAPSPQYNNTQASPPPPPQAAQDPDELHRIQEREQARARMQQAQAEARGGTGPIKIKENYVPRAAQRAANRNVVTALCPNCKQKIPMDELDEHMRIELLDPKWKEQKAKADSRYSTTNLSTVDVAGNLKRLASQRTDVFDAVSGQPVSEEEQARRKRAAINSFDGNPDGVRGSGGGGPAAHHAHQHAPQHAVNVEEQIRAIHQKFAGDKK